MLRGLVKQLSDRSLSSTDGGKPKNPLRGLGRQLSEKAVGRSLAEAQRNYHLGRMEADRGRWRTALKHYNAALTKQREHLGEDHLDAGRTLNDIGIALTNIGEDYAALTALKEALYIRQEALGPGDEKIAETLSHLTQLLHNVRSKENTAVQLGGQPSEEKHRLSTKIEKAIDEAHRRKSENFELRQEQLDELRKLVAEASCYTV